MLTPLSVSTYLTLPRSPRSPPAVEQSEYHPPLLASPSSPDPMVFNIGMNPFGDLMTLICTKSSSELRQPSRISNNTHRRFLRKPRKAIEARGVSRGWPCLWPLGMLGFQMSTRMFSIKPLSSTVTSLNHFVSLTAT